MGTMSDAALDDASRRRAAEPLGVRDPTFGEVLRRHGPPPLWDRDPGFPTLVHLILEQQVSLASARRPTIGCFSDRGSAYARGASSP